MLYLQRPVSEYGADSAGLELKKLRPLRIVIHNQNPIGQRLQLSNRVGTHLFLGGQCPVLRLLRSHGEQASAVGAPVSGESLVATGARGAWALEAPADPPDDVDAAVASGASLYFSSSAFSGGTDCIFSCRQAARFVVNAEQDSWMAASALSDGAASPVSIMKSMRARSRLTGPMPGEVRVPDWITSIFVSRSFRASAASDPPGSPDRGPGGPVLTCGFSFKLRSGVFRVSASVSRKAAMAF